MKISEMTEQELRERYRIPKRYAGPIPYRGDFLFDDMDSTIRVEANGQCTESHMAVGVDGHYFTRDVWPPGAP